MAVSQIAYRRIAKKVQSPLPHPATPWTAPTLPELVARIDAALDARRAA